MVSNDQQGKEELAMESTIPLQPLLGTDKRNPCLSVYRDREDQSVQVYYGAELLERVKGGETSCEYRLLLGRLYNAGVKVVALEKAFGVGGKTLRRLGRALEKGDAEELVQVLAGRGGRRKLTPEIRGYIRMRFSRIYEEDRYRYNERLRAEVAEVFGVQRSGRVCAGCVRS